MLFRKAQPRLKKLYSLLLPHDELQYVPHQETKTFSVAMSSASSIKLLKQTAFFFLKILLLNSIFAYKKKMEKDRAI